MDLAGWLRFIAEQHEEEMALGLERSRAVACRLGLLPLPLRTITIAGTNGKGSTALFAEGLLRRAGKRVGVTLSPHLERFNERIRIDGEELDDAFICDAFAAVEDARGDTPLTYYEFAILAALVAFRSAGVDVVVLEVGLGGRLDTVNVVDADVAVVTSIGLDHQAQLGDTLEAIGPEKSAVARTGAPLILGAEMPDSVLRDAAARAVPTRQFGTDHWYITAATDWRVHCAGRELRSAAAPRVARRNACNALAAVVALGTDLDDGMFEGACRDVGNPGRIEPFSWFGRDRRARVRVVEGVLDVAHNPAAARFLAQQLAARYPGKRFVACAGFLRDKDVAGIGAALDALVRDWIIADVDGQRGLSAASARERLGWGEIEPQPLAAAERAADLCGEADMMLVLGCFAHVQRVRGELAGTLDRGTLGA
ncbi:MAG: Mur ligase family protein [Planctomycetota bacterium]